MGISTLLPARLVILENILPGVSLMLATMSSHLQTHLTDQIHSVIELGFCH
jgi:hypothetical protein